jgi:hypothetical protein
MPPRPEPPSPKWPLPPVALEYRPSCNRSDGGQGLRVFRLHLLRNEADPRRRIALAAIAVEGLAVLKLTDLFDVFLQATV